jgi:hypothetical protein
MAQVLKILKEMEKLVPEKTFFPRRQVHNTRQPMEPDS